MMGKNVENIGINEVAKQMTRMNNDSVIVVNIYGEDCLASFICPEELKFPAGYYWNEKNGVTNKHNTASGMYETFKLIKLSEY